MYIVAWVEVDKSNPDKEKLIDRYEVFIELDPLARAQKKYSELKETENVYTACFGNLVSSTEDYEKDEPDQVNTKPILWASLECQTHHSLAKGGRSSFLAKGGKYE